MSLDNTNKKEKRRKVFFFIRITLVSFLYLLFLLLSLFLGFDFIAGGLVFKNYIWGISFVLLSTLGLILLLVYLFKEIDKILSPLVENKVKRVRLKIFLKKAKNLLFTFIYKKEKWLSVKIILDNLKYSY